MSPEDIIKKKMAPLQEAANNGKPEEQKGSLKTMLAETFSPKSFFADFNFGTHTPPARDGDWVIGLDRHLVFFTLPPLPPVPLGMHFIPFIGRISLSSRSPKAYGKGTVFSKKIAPSGILVKGRFLNHQGFLLPGLPLVCGSLSPFSHVRLSQKRMHNVIISKTGSSSKVLLCGRVTAVGFCSPTSHYYILPSQKNIKI